VREQRTASKQERAGIHVFPYVGTYSTLIATGYVSIYGNDGVGGVRVSVLLCCQSAKVSNERMNERLKGAKIRTLTHSPTHSLTQSLT